jgi:hypothetical protein
VSLRALAAINVDQIDVPKAGEHARGVGSISFTARCFDSTITVRLGNDSVSYFSGMCDEAGRRISRCDTATTNS